jgi:hypothetical protein
MVVVERAELEDAHGAAWYDRRRMRREDVRNALLLALLAALVRFPTLGHQSFEHDEAITVSLIVHPSLVDTVRAVGGETSPPLFYVLEWLMSKLFGSGEVAMRSVSALAGTLTGPVVYELGRATISRRVGLVAGALIAVSPVLVWYSQDARPYALLVFLGALSLLCLVRAVESGTRFWLAAWALACAAAFASHWFAGFLIAPEAAWLLLRRRGSRDARWAVAGTAAATVVLLPLLIHQSAHGGADWIATIDLGYRIREAGEEFVSGNDPRSVHPVPLLAALVVAAALALLALRADEHERRGGLFGLGIGLAACVLPLAFSLAGRDFLIAKNLLVALAPLTLGVAAGLGARRAGLPGLALAAVLFCLSLGMVVAVSRDSTLQRWDARGAARAMGRPTGERAVVVPYNQDIGLAIYLADWKPAGPSPRVDEVVVLGRYDPDRLRAPSGFRRVETRRLTAFEMTRFRAALPLRVSRRRLATTDLGGGCTPSSTVSGCEQGSVLLERPSG